jgi:hypothetical protein
MADGLLHGRREMGGSTSVLVGEWVGLALFLACVVNCKWSKRTGGQGLSLFRVSTDGVEMMQRARFGVPLPVHQPHENPLPPEGFLYCVARGLRPGFIIPLRLGSLNLTAFYS